MAEAFAEGAASINVKEIREAAQHNATIEERTRILGLAAIQFGDEPGAKLKAIVESGATVEQLQAFMALNPPVAPSATAEDLKRQEMLAAIKAAGADNPGSDGPATTAPKDWAAIVEAYQQEHKCSRSAAIKAVEVSHPGLRVEYLKRENPGKEISHG
jgi:hypothetical protein